MREVVIEDITESVADDPEKIIETEGRYSITGYVYETISSR